jgi:hypothetical protein
MALTFPKLFKMDTRKRFCYQQEEILSLVSENLAQRIAFRIHAQQTSLIERVVDPLSKTILLH